MIESVPEDGDTICAINGHLSPYNNLSVGDTVFMGGRIGQIGNSVTPDNGGYWAHLHLGIEKKPFSRAVIGGYDMEIQNYENPIILIKSHLQNFVHEQSRINNFLACPLIWLKGIFENEYLTSHPSGFRGCSKYRIVFLVISELYRIFKEFQ